MDPKKAAPGKATEGSAAPSAQLTSGQGRRGAWALLIGVIIMFLLVITAWTTLIKIARENPVEQIEIQSGGSD